jgi:hypothetical protein
MNSQLVASHERGAQLMDPVDDHRDVGLLALIAGRCPALTRI